MKHSHAQEDSCCANPGKVREKKHAGHAHHSQEFRKKFWISLLLSVPVLALSPMIQMLFGLKELSFMGSGLIVFLLSSIIFFYGGFPFLTGLYSEVSQKKPGMMTLVGVAISAAYAYSAAVFAGLPGEELFWELVTLVDIMLLGHWIEMRSVGRASRALEELAHLMPSTAHKITDDGWTKDVKIQDLVVGDKVLIKPGEKVPVDGVVIDGKSSVNESMLTGESKLVDKKERMEVIGGSINGDGSLVVRIEKVGRNTYLNQIIEIVASAQRQKSETQKLADRAAMWLTVIALTGGVLTLLGWVFFSEETFAYALERAITVVVIACPHALGLAIPLVVSTSTAISAKSGLLIRNRTAFEEARNVTAVVLDKTGTLTRGEFGVKDVVPLGESSREEILSYASAIEALSEHPIAKAIANEAKEILPVEDFVALPGRGARGTVKGREIQVVSPGYLEEKKIEVKDGEIKKLLEEGKTIVYVLSEEKPIGAIALDDIVRAEAKEAIARLNRLDIEPILLTGDIESVAKRVSNELGIRSYIAGVLPHQKSEKIKELQKSGKTVAMVGDGVNDAPALAQADVGLAIGAGTDVAIETADVVLVKSDPRGVSYALELAKNTYRKMVQNLWWASGYNIVGIPLAAGVLAGAGVVLSPAVGAALMSASTVIVAINATMLKSNNN